MQNCMKSLVKSVQQNKIVKFVQQNKIVKFVQQYKIKSLIQEEILQSLTIIWPNGPIFIMFWNCSYISLNVK